MAKLRAVLARRQPDLTLVLDGVRKGHNLSAIPRTGDSVGVLRVHGGGSRGGGGRHPR